MSDLNGELVDNALTAFEDAKRAVDLASIGLPEEASSDVSSLQLRAVMLGIEATHLLLQGAQSTEHSGQVQQEYLSSRDAATYLGVSLASIRRWTKSGDLQALRTPGGHRRISREALDAVMRPE